MARLRARKAGVSMRAGARAGAGAMRGGWLRLRPIEASFAQTVQRAKGIPTFAIKFADEALRKKGLAILKRAQSYVPYKTGALSRSGRLQKHITLALSVGYKVSFGNDEIRYAIVQHEDLNLKHPRGRIPKYLEVAGVELTGRNTLEILRGIGQVRF